MFPTLFQSQEIEEKISGDLSSISTRVVVLVANENDLASFEQLKFLVYNTKLMTN